MSRILLALLLAAVTQAQSHEAMPPREPVPPIPRAALNDFAGVFVDDTLDTGTTWIRGTRYKLRLDADGATYIPLFGPRAPRSWPVTLTLRSLTAGGERMPLGAAPWQREAKRFTRDLGNVVERWDCTPGHAQHSFVLPRPVQGGIELEVQIATDLAIDGNGPGVTFRGPAEFGAVTYSDAVVLGADGSRLEVPVEVVGRALRIAVPALPAAAYPLVVDPLVSTVFVDPRVSDVVNPRVAAEPTSNTWLVVAEEHVSATDVDIVCHRFDASLPNPTLLDTVYAEIAGAFAHNPAVGFVAATQHYVVAWHDATAGNIQYRTRTATSAVQGTTRVIAQGLGNDLRNHCAIGSALAGDRFLLAMFRTGPNGQDVLVLYTSVGGTSFGSDFLSPLAGEAPDGDVSTIQTANEKWVVVWKECAPGCTSTTLYMRAVNSPSGNGLALDPLVTLATSGQTPRIAGYGGKQFAVWSDPAIGGGHLLGLPIASVAGVPTPTFPAQNLTAMEPGAVPNHPQTAPVVSYDGVRFVYAYLEDEQNGFVRPYAATILLQGSLVTFHEGHLLLPTTANAVTGALAITASTGILRGNHFAVWDEPTLANANDVQGAIVDARLPGTTSSLTATGCGTPTVPTITLSGTPGIGRTFTVSTSTPGVPFLVVGSPFIVSLRACGNCQTGVDMNTAIVFFGSSLSVTIPAQTSFLGFPLAFQFVMLGGTGGCPPTAFGAPLNMSDTLSIQAL